LGFLIDNGLIQNINLDSFADRENIFDKLIITEAGKRYITLREKFASEAHALEGMAGGEPRPPEQTGVHSELTSH
jgi:hypothetical protein